MRLLDAQDFSFHEVHSHGPFPAFAILSHTWIQPSSQEVTYQDLLTLDPKFVRQKQGWRKLQYTIEEARRGSIPYVWVDTCCINKLDPTELTEAINCMFNWYSYSRCCYVFLPDVLQMDQSHEHSFSYIVASKWFRRGWTLQELIAPREVHIYDRRWNLITTRARAASLIASRTNIDKRLLQLSSETCSHPHGVDMALLEQYRIAQRMAWAAGRETSRSEDRAYSLLGLFNIVMPLRYGEGAEHAFKRLQQEIIKQSADQSILAWKWPPERTLKEASELQMHFLAPWPDCFATRGHVIPSRRYREIPYNISNVGLEIEVCLVRFEQHSLRMIMDIQGVPSTRVLNGLERRAEPFRGRGLLYEAKREVSEPPLVAAFLDCISAIDPSLVYVLPLAPAPTGHYVLTGSLRCEQLDWTRLPLEGLLPDQSWRKVTILRTPRRSLQDLAMAEIRRSPVKVELVHGQDDSKLLVSELFWPLGAWNKESLTYLPNDAVTDVNAAAFSVRCTWPLFPVCAESFITIAFSYGWDSLIDLQAHTAKEAPELKRIKACCGSLNPETSKSENVEDTDVVRFTGGLTVPLTVTMRRHKPPMQ